MSFSYFHLNMLHKLNTNYSWRWANSNIQRNSPPLLERRVPTGVMKCFDSMMCADNVMSPPAIPSHWAEFGAYMCLHMSLLTDKTPAGPMLVANASALSRGERQLPSFPRFSLRKMLMPCSPVGLNYKLSASFSLPRAVLVGLEPLSWLASWLCRSHPLSPWLM